MISILPLCNLHAQVIIFNGISVSQLRAHCLCLNSSKPTCATDGSPLLIAVHLHPPLRGVVASHQPNLELIWHISETSGVCKKQIRKQFIRLEGGGLGEVFRCEVRWHAEQKKNNKNRGGLETRLLEIHVD